MNRKKTTATNKRPSAVGPRRVRVETSVAPVTSLSFEISKGAVSGIERKHPLAGIAEEFSTVFLKDEFLRQTKVIVSLTQKRGDSRSGVATSEEIRKACDFLRVERKPRDPLFSLWKLGYSGKPGSSPIEITVRWKPGGRPHRIEEKHQPVSKISFSLICHHGKPQVEPPSLSWSDWPNILDFLKERVFFRFHRMADFAARFSLTDLDTDDDEGLPPLSQGAEFAAELADAIVKGCEAVSKGDRFETKFFENSVLVRAEPIVIEAFEPHKSPTFRSPVRTAPETRDGLSLDPEVVQDRQVTPTPQPNNKETRQPADEPIASPEVALPRSPILANLMSVRAAAKEIGISYKTLQRAVNAGRIEVFKLGDDRPLVNLNDCKAAFPHGANPVGRPRKNKP